MEHDNPLVPGGIILVALVRFDAHHQCPVRQFDERVRHARRPDLLRHRHIPEGRPGLAGILRLAQEHPRWQATHRLGVEEPLPRIGPAVDPQEDADQVTQTHLREAAEFQAAADAVYSERFDRKEGLAPGFAEVSGATELESLVVTILGGPGTPVGKQVTVGQRHEVWEGQIGAPRACFASTQDTGVDDLHMGLRDFPVPDDIHSLRLLAPLPPSARAYAGGIAVHAVGAVGEVVFDVAGIEAQEKGLNVLGKRRHFVRVAFLDLSDRAGPGGTVGNSEHAARAIAVIGEIAVKDPLVDDGRRTRLASDHELIGMTEKTVKPQDVQMSSSPKRSERKSTIVGLAMASIAWGESVHCTLECPLW